MGRDKLSLEVDGVPLLARGYSVLARLCDEVVIVGDGGDGTVPEAHRIPDSRSGRQGPLAGLEAGMEAVEGGVILAVAGDMPFVSEDLLLHLARLVRDGDEAAVPVEEGRIHPLCAAYRRETLSKVRDALDSGKRDMRGFLNRLDRVSYAPVEGGEFGEPGIILMNVNSPGDLEKARRKAVEQRR